MSLNACIHRPWQIQDNLKNKVRRDILPCFAFAATVAHTANSTIHSSKWFVFFTGKTLNTVIHRASTESCIDCMAVLANAPDHFLSHDIPQSFAKTSFTTGWSYGEALNQAIKPFYSSLKASTFKHTR